MKTFPNDTDSFSLIGYLVSEFVRYYPTSAPIIVVDRVAGLIVVELASARCSALESEPLVYQLEEHDEYFTFMDGEYDDDTGEWDAYGDDETITIPFPAAWRL